LSATSLNIPPTASSGTAPSVGGLNFRLTPTGAPQNQYALTTSTSQGLVGVAASIWLSAQ
jgi:hypothetical protein